MEVSDMNVKIYSREQMEAILAKGFPENTAVISFYDPIMKENEENYVPIDYTKVCENVFYVCIHDIAFDELEEYGITFGNYFTEVQQLAEFILFVKNAGMDIICQCEHGESRSAACAAAILEYFYHSGINVFADYRYCPNQMVYHKVYDALKTLKQQ